MEKQIKAKKCYIKRKFPNTNINKNKKELQQRTSVCHRNTFKNKYIKIRKKNNCNKL